MTWDIYRNLTAQMGTLPACKILSTKLPIFAVQERSVDILK